MCIGIDGDQAACLDRQSDMAIAKIQPQRIGVDLQRRLGLPGSLDELGHVGRKPLSSIDDPSGRVADDVDKWMSDRLEQTLGRLGRILPQGDMRRGDHQIQLGQQLIVVIKGPIREDVDLRTGQNPNSLEFGIDFMDRIDMSQKSLLRKAVGLHAGAGVIGHGDGMESPGLRLKGERANTQHAIAGIRVAVQFGSNGGHVNEFAGCLLDAIAFLPQLRWMEGQFEGFVYRLLCLRGLRGNTS